MELVMSSYRNVAAFRVLFVVGICGEQTNEVGKLNADLSDLGSVFKLVDGFVQRTYGAIKEGWYLLPGPGQSLQPRRYSYAT